MPLLRSALFRIVLFCGFNFLEVNTLFKVNILKPTCRKKNLHIKITYLNINPINKITAKNCQSSIIMSSNKHKRTLPKADTGQPHTSKMELKRFFTKSLMLYVSRSSEFASNFNVNKKSFGFI